MQCNPLRQVGQTPAFSQINTANAVIPMKLPSETLVNIFNHSTFKGLKLFTEHKTQVLKEPLNGKEDPQRLMLDKNFLFNKTSFLEVVKDVYNSALCCKFFYALTEQKRNLLFQAASHARITKDFFIYDKIPMVQKENENKLNQTDEIFKYVQKENLKDICYKAAPSIDPTKSLPSEALMEAFTKSFISKIDYKQLFEPLKQDFNLLSSNENFMEKFNVALNLNLITDNQEQSTDSDD